MRNHQTIRKAPCAYCGAQPAGSRDHIPPQGLFPKPRTADLITVPCCEPCRKGWSRDDEYFCGIITMACGEDPRAAERVRAVLRSIRKPNKAGYSRMIRDSLKPIEVMSKGGIYLGSVPGMTIDPKRISRVIERIIRALYYHESGSPLSRDCEVTTWMDQFGDVMKEVTSRFNFKHHTIIGDNVFLYTYLHDNENDSVSVWLGGFYEDVAFGGFTTPREDNAE